MHPDALCLGQRVAQLEERDVGGLRDQLFKESPMRRRLSAAAPSLHPWQGTPSNATLRPARPTLLQYILETAHEVPMAMLPT